MQNAYRTVQRLEGHHLVIDLPNDFPETGTAEIIVLPLDPTAPHSRRSMTSRRYDHTVFARYCPKGENTLHLETELDDVYAEWLLNLQKRFKQTLAITEEVNP
jgi:hypothetical protein